MSQLAIFPAKLCERSREKETAVRAVAICDTLTGRNDPTQAKIRVGSSGRPGMRIDAHQHFWDPARRDYGWLEKLEGEPANRLQRPFLPADLSPILERHGIDRTILVQAAPTEAEAEYLLGIAERHAFVAGAVVWLDLEAPEFDRRLDALQRRREFLGVRPMLHDLPDPEWMLRPSVRRAFAALQDRDVCFDFLVRPVHLAPMLRILAEFPKLRAVVDHIAKPEIRGRQMEPWRTLLQRVAEHPGLYCKLSGMITEADHASWAPEDLFPYVEHALGCFGPARCMFGSDWPVCTLAGSYDQVLSALEHSLDDRDCGRGIDAPSRERIWGGTAAEFYRLPRASSAA
jgi:L-fuconolactonase